MLLEKPIGKNNLISKIKETFVISVSGNLPGQMKIELPKFHLVYLSSV